MIRLPNLNRILENLDSATQEPKEQLQSLFIKTQLLYFIREYAASHSSYVGDCYCKYSNNQGCLISEITADQPCSQ